MKRLDEKNDHFCEAKERERERDVHKKVEKKLAVNK